MSIPYFAFYPKDWLADTGHLSYEERGVYFDLLCHMWIRSENECGLPDNDQFLANLLGVPISKWRKLRAVLVNGVAPVLTANEGRISSKRLAQEFAIAKQKSDKAAQSARTRWQPTEPPPSIPPPHTERNADASANGYAMGYADALPTDLQSQCYPDKDKELDLDVEIPPTPQPATPPQPEAAATAARATDPIQPSKPTKPKRDPAPVSGWNYPLLWQLITDQQGYAPDWNYAAQTKAVNRILAKHPGEQPGDLARFLAYKATCFRADPHSQPTFTAYEADYAGWMRAGKPARFTRDESTPARPAHLTTVTGRPYQVVTKGA